jgi:hypothetical protein
MDLGSGQQRGSTEIHNALDHETNIVAVSLFFAT